MSKLEIEAKEHFRIKNWDFVNRGDTSLIVEFDAEVHSETALVYCNECGAQADVKDRYCRLCARAIRRPFLWQVSGRTLFGVGFAIIVIMSLLAFALVQQTVVSHLQSQLSNSESQTSNLQSQNQNLQSQVSADQSRISSLQSELASARYNVTHPKVIIWATPDNYTVGQYGLETVPDTFDYYDSWTSTVPITVYYLSNTQYVQFTNCGFSCVTGKYYSIAPATSSNDVFTLAEGCGGYVAIYVPCASGTIHPNIAVQYNPSPAATGVCAE